MATSVVPDLIDALVTACTTALPNVLVFDGFGVTDDPGDFLMIGVEDPDVDGAAFSADVRQETGPMGTNRPRNETGDIVCAALSWNGDADPKAARDAVYATADALENLLRADPSVGVTGYQLVVAQFGSSSQLSQNQSETGAIAMLIFRVSFFARI